MGGFWCYFLDFFGLMSPERLHTSRVEPAVRQSLWAASPADSDRIMVVREEASSPVRVAA
jgi:hypothetical protein